MRPFTYSYVIKITIKNMMECVSKSIDKTYERIPELADNRQASNDIFLALATLQRIKLVLIELENTYSKKGE